MEKKTTKKLIEEEFSINQKLGKYMEYAKAKCDISEKGARIRVNISNLKKVVSLFTKSKQCKKFF